MKMKEKKDGWRVGLIVGMIILVAFFFGMPLWWSHTSEVACKELGFSHHSARNGMDMCEDSAGNLHYVKMEDKGFIGLGGATAKEISVGGVRVV